MWDGSPGQLEQSFARRTGTTYRLLLRASQIGRLYGLGRTSYVVVDHDGIVRYVTNQTFNPNIVRQVINASLEALAESQASGAGTETVVGGQEILPDRFALLPNYPNPFNAETTIGFRLDRETELTLRIFDAVGRSVRKVTMGRFNPGAFEFTWDGRDDRGHPVSSGVYFYHLNSPDRHATRPLVLLR